MTNANKLYINPKVQTKYSIDSGKCVIAIKRLENREVIFKIPLKDCLKEKKEPKLILYSFPLILKLLDHPDHLTKYNSHEEYKDQCGMYRPIYNIQSECKRNDIDFRTIMIRWMLILYVIDVLATFNPGQSFEKIDFAQLIHAFHIVETRCVLNSSTNEILLADYFDNINASAQPNCSYTFDSKYLIVRATEQIKANTEVFAMYSTEMTRERAYCHYYYCTTEFPSSPEYEDTEREANIQFVMKLVSNNKQMSVYDLFLQMKDDKEFCAHLEMMLS